MAVDGFVDDYFFVELGVFFFFEVYIVEIEGVLVGFSCPLHPML